jgi:hypothetical protein
MVPEMVPPIGEERRELIPLRWSKLKITLSLLYSWYGKKKKTS